MERMGGGETKDGGANSLKGSTKGKEVNYVKKLRVVVKGTL